MELKELQLYKLEVLKKFADICDKNGIRYMLYYGTLLGAVRHGGFIPWDDDIDVTVPWTDYLKLIKIINRDYKKEFFAQNIWTEKYFPFLWTQLRVNGTTSMPVAHAALDIHWGICIDIFPLVAVDTEPRKLKKQKRSIALAKAFIGKEYMEVKNQKAEGKQKLINALPRGIRLFAANRILKKYEKDPCGSEMSCMFQNPKYVFKTEDVLDTVEMSFEGLQFKAPKNYDPILKTLYKDYMTLPPEEKRGGHELTLGDTIINIHKDYSEYRKELMLNKNR